MWVELSVDNKVAVIHETKPEFHPSIPLIEVDEAPEIGDIYISNSNRFQTPKWRIEHNGDLS